MAGLDMDVVQLTEENTRLRSERDNAVQVRERGLADVIRLLIRNPAKNPISGTPF